MKSYKKEIKNLVKEGLMSIPANVRFSIGDYGDFTKDQLITEIDKGTEIGNGAIDMQLQFIRSMPTILNSDQK